jgi:hypothetical protein
MWKGCKQSNDRGKTYCTSAEGFMTTLLVLLTAFDQQSYFFLRVKERLICLKVIEKVKRMLKFYLK